MTQFFKNSVAQTISLRFCIAGLVAFNLLAAPSAKAAQEETQYFGLQMTISSSCHRSLLTQRAAKPAESMVDGVIRYALKEQRETIEIVKYTATGSMRKEASKLQSRTFENDSIPGRKGQNDWHFFIDVERGEDNQVYFTYDIKADLGQVNNLRNGKYRCAVVITSGTWEGYLKGEETKFQFTPESLAMMRAEQAQGIKRIADQSRDFINNLMQSNGSGMQMLPTDNIQTIAKFPEVFRAIDGKLVSGSPTRTNLINYTVVVRPDQLLEKIDERIQIAQSTLDALLQNGNATSAEIDRLRATADDLRLISELSKVMAIKIEQLQVVARNEYERSTSGMTTAINLNQANQEIIEVRRQIEEVVNRLPATEGALRRMVDTTSN